MDGYKKHGITHSSPSAINKWINAPDAWVSSYLFGHRGAASSAMWRGICTENAVSDVISGKSGIDDAIAAAQMSFDEKILFDEDGSAAKERGNIEAMTKLAVDALEPYGQPDPPEGGGQTKVSLTAKGDGWEIPFIGFTDFDFNSRGLIIDLKTTGRMPGVMSLEHQRQRAFYAAATNYQVLFLYVTPKKAELKEDGDVVELMAEIKHHMTRQERFLRLGDKELLRDVVPVNPSSFYWKGDEAIRKDLYGV